MEQQGCATVSDFGRLKMSKKRLALDWGIKSKVEDFKPTWIRFRKYLIDNGALHGLCRSLCDKW
jgi:hypothetical protein